MSNWSDEELALLREKRIEGWSATMIGCLLGRTRNSVIGKAFRGGLPARKPAGPERIKGPSAMMMKKTKHRSAPQRALPPNEVSHPKAAALPEQPPLDDRRGAVAAVLHLTASMCRWPLSDPKGDDFHYCCRQVDPNHNPRYCAEHAAMHGAGVYTLGRAMRETARARGA